MKGSGTPTRFCGEGFTCATLTAVPEMPPSVTAPLTSYPKVPLASKRVPEMKPWIASRSIGNVSDASMMLPRTVARTLPLVGHLPARVPDRLARPS
jgi:hypothetical protein